MPSKILKLSFPEEDLDVYTLLKSKAKPSKFVIDAIRFYQANKSKNTKSSVNIDKMIEDKVASAINAKVSEIPKYDEASVREMVERLVSEKLKNIKTISVSDSQENSSALTNDSKEVGKLDLSTVEDNSGFDFSKAISCFDDD